VRVKAGILTLDDFDYRDRTVILRVDINSPINHETGALANDNRMKRHVNPWNHPVKVHTYEEWEEEFHDKIVAAGLPLDKE